MGDIDIQANGDAELFETFARRGGNGGREGGQQPVSLVQQGHLHGGAGTVDAEIIHRVRDLEQFGGKLNTRRAAAHDRDTMRSACLRRLHQPGGRGVSIGHRFVQRIDVAGMIGDPGNTEVVRLAADRQHQRVIGKMTLGQQGKAVAVEGVDGDAARIQIDGGGAAGMIKEAMLARLRKIRHADTSDVMRAGRDAVQHRFPDMGRGEVDQRDVQFLVPGQRAGEVQSGDATAHDQDAVCVALPGGAKTGLSVRVVHRPGPPTFFSMPGASRTLVRYRRREISGHRFSANGDRVAMGSHLRARSSAFHRSKCPFVLDYQCRSGSVR